MKILHLNKNNKWTAIQKKLYENEAELQNLLAKDVTILPLDEIQYDAPFVTIGKEVSLNNGSLDLLAVSTKGQILVIETKLDKNPEVKRTVVGQVLGYAANIWNKTYEDIESFFSSFLKQQKINYSGKLADYVKEKVGDETFSEEEFKKGIEQKLQLGSFTLLIVVDQANKELKDIANYLNERTGQEIDFYVIEVEQIGDKDETFLIPRLANPPRKNIIPKTTVGSLIKDQYDRTPISKDAFFNRISLAGKKLAEQLLAKFENNPITDITWRKNGFSIQTTIPKKLIRKDFNITYSYFFFHVGTLDHPENDYLYFWYPEYSYTSSDNKSLDLKPYIEAYTNFYRSLPGLNEKKEIHDLSIFTDDRINKMIKLILLTAEQLSEMRTISSSTT